MSEYRQVIHSKDDFLTFGKHQGKSVAHVMMIDPDYLLWAYEKEIIDVDEDILIEVEVRSDTE